MPKLDPTTTEFRAAAHKAVDWVADYLENIDSFPVLSRVQPGEIAAQFDGAASEEGKPYDALLTEFQQKILPGITHWNHPSFFAYFSITGSQAGILGELLSAAINANGMLWKTSPSLTELETLSLGWLRDALGLPSHFFGIINDTASINVFLALAAAREALGLNIRKEGMTGRELPPLRVYCSEHAHSSVDKAALALGFGAKNIVKIASDDEFRMRPDALEEAISRDRADELLPCVVVATTGTTSTAAVDPVRAIGEIAQRERCWLHVDAAYAGSATIAPEYRWIWDGVAEYADSLVTNPHKWLFTPVDCSVLYTRRPDVLRETFSLVPEFLKTTDTAEINYMNYGLQLGRRFRALKLWLVLEHYGLERLRNVIREHVAFAERLATELRQRDGVTVLAQSFSVVVFKLRTDEETIAVLERMNASGQLFVSHTKLRGDYAIRVAIGNGATEWLHVSRILDHV
ncbi:MAG TPA: aminotransferase class I/II-fold pyridoxal phosphate-dependent enzyme [Thermoanaerobaculia bacterium]|jgi:aromatic-L-amino-acid decarboxylase